MALSRIKTESIQDGAVATSDLLDAAVTAAKMGAGAARANFGAGAILQVVQTNKTSSFSAASAAPTFVDITGLSATITPISTTSKILVMYSAYICAGNSSGQYQTITRLVRNGSAIDLGDARTGLTQAGAGGGTPAYWYPSCHSLKFLDSPGTTSPITYGVQMCSEGGVASIVGGSYNTGNALGFTAPSQITLMEIAG